MKEISLTNSDKKTLVDDEDFVELSTFSWFLHQSGYVKRTTRDGIQIHRYLTSCSDNENIDHIDRDKLNNQKFNLRKASNSQNAINKHYPNRLGYRGVKYNSGKYEAQITVNYKYKYLGRFSSMHDAAEAYNKAALELHGAFAQLNVIVKP